MIQHAHDRVQEHKPSTQYEGVFEIAAIDEKGCEYYFVGTPCGRTLLRPSTVSTETV